MKLRENIEKHFQNIHLRFRRKFPAARAVRVDEPAGADPIEDQKREQDEVKRDGTRRDWNTNDRRRIRQRRRQEQLPHPRHAATVSSESFPNKRLEEALINVQGGCGPEKGTDSLQFL